VSRSAVEGIRVGDEVAIMADLTKHLRKPPPRPILGRGPARSAPPDDGIRPPECNDKSADGTTEWNPPAGSSGVSFRQLMRTIGWISGLRLAAFLSCVWAGLSMFVDWPRVIEILAFIPIVVGAIAIERWFWNWD
jgi:hypothetical protein